MLNYYLLNSDLECFYQLYKNNSNNIVSFELWLKSKTNGDLIYYKNNYLIRFVNDIDLYNFMTKFLKN